MLGANNTNKKKEEHRRYFFVLCQLQSILENI
jgi:hypothetical protein